ncbi:hypothetical protein OOZ15_00330 [Galbibacter sp. EGI 63066]|uniref:hypothetical protein n=1 Tax=Galbibacter sp. EGI 63066 TaxID=2993559 RepID=UPI0022494DDC|nr:hypothetical protein [Galbibacter sp. EGI 63066]MCX2678375.1 hypothetical protein [Galbibacter sp. EGI 63066]
MKNGRLKNSITSLFLVLFISMKMTGLHVLSHTNDKDHAIHCTICDHAITHNLTPALTPDLQDFTIENTEPIVQGEITKNYNFIALSNLASGQLFSRPPPSLL